MSDPDYRYSAWIVIGTSPLARESLEWTRDHSMSHWPHLFPVTIGTNGAIRVCPQPDFYYAYDFVACDQYEAEAMMAAKRGTRIIGPKLRMPAPVEHALRYGCPPNEKLVNTVRYHLPGAELEPTADYEPLQLSGMFILEYAAKRASEVIMCGMDGYAERGEWYAEGVYGHGQTRAKNITDTLIVPRVRRLLEKYPEVQFTCVGRPVYADRIDAQNWRVQWLPLPDATPTAAS